MSWWNEDGTIGPEAARHMLNRLRREGGDRDGGPFVAAVEMWMGCEWDYINTQPTFTHDIGFIDELADFFDQLAAATRQLAQEQKDHQAKWEAEINGRSKKNKAPKGDKAKAAKSKSSKSAKRKAAEPAEKEESGAEGLGKVCKECAENCGGVIASTEIPVWCKHHAPEGVPF